MASHDYVFVTRWRVRGTREEVSDILEDVLSLPRWWPSVYLGVNELAPGRPGGVGRTVRFITRGRLPYRLRWEGTIVESRRPLGFTLAARGDIEGRGVWTFEEDGDWVNIRFDWRVRANKPLLRRLSGLLKPAFAANHRWAMARGEESLARELVRRREGSARPSAAAGIHR